MTIEQQLILDSLLNPHTLVTTDIKLDMYQNQSQVIEGGLMMPNQELTVNFGYYYNSGGSSEDGGQIDSTWDTKDFNELGLWAIDEDGDELEIPLTEDQEQIIFNLIVNNQTI